MDYHTAASSPSPSISSSDTSISESPVVDNMDRSQDLAEDVTPRFMQLGLCRMLGLCDLHDETLEEILGTCSQGDLDVGTLFLLREKQTGKRLEEKDGRLAEGYEDDEEYEVDDGIESRRSNAAGDSIESVVGRHEGNVLVFGLDHDPEPENPTTYGCGSLDHNNSGDSEANSSTRTQDDDTDKEEASETISTEAPDNSAVTNLVNDKILSLAPRLLTLPLKSGRSPFLRAELRTLDGDTTFLPTVPDFDLGNEVCKTENVVFTEANGSSSASRSDVFLDETDQYSSEGSHEATNGSIVESVGIDSDNASDTCARSANGSPFCAGCRVENVIVQGTPLLQEYDDQTQLFRAQLSELSIRVDEELSVVSTLNRALKVTDRQIGHLSETKLELEKERGVRLLKVLSLQRKRCQLELHTMASDSDKVTSRRWRNASKTCEQHLEALFFGENVISSPVPPGCSSHYQLGPWIAILVMICCVIISHVLER